MLDVTKLEDDLYKCFHETFPTAFEECFKASYDRSSDQGNAMAKDFATRFDNIVSKALAKRLAATIDAYIKTGCIVGTINVTGPPVSPLYTGILAPVNLGNVSAGKTPNTLGII